MSDALRELLASFTVEVDKAGELAKGNAAIDALHARLKQITEAAKPAAKAVRNVFAQADAARGKYIQAQGAAALGTSTRGGDGFAALAGLKQAAALRESQAAAAAYATTLRGRLGTAIGHVREGFNAPRTGILSGLNAFRLGVAGFVGGAVARGIVHTVEGIGDIREQAARLGVTTDDFQRLDVLAKQNATSVETLGTAFRTLANGAVQPTKESTAAFAKLGVVTKQNDGTFKSSQDLFFEVAASLADIGDETQRSALAQDLLGRSAQQLKPIFAGGREEIEKQRAALARMAVLSEETIIRADELADSWVSLRLELMAAAGPVIEKLVIPALEGITALVREVAHWVTHLTKDLHPGRLALTAFGIGFANLIPTLRLVIGLGGGFGPMLLRWAGAAGKAAYSFARMVLPLLALEDFIGFLTGADSLLGRGLDKLLGEGGGEGVRKNLIDLAMVAKDVMYWLAGGDLGSNAKNLYRDLSDFIRLITNDLLKLLGIGDGGLNGPVKSDVLGGIIDAGKAALPPGVALALDAIGAARGGGGASADTIPTARQLTYGPPTAAGSVAGNTPIIGDTNITINGVAPGEARAAADRVGFELERSRDAILAGVP